MRVICNFRDLEREKLNGLDKKTAKLITRELNIFKEEFGLFDTLKSDTNNINGVVVLESVKDFQEIGKGIKDWPEETIGSGLDFWKKFDNENSLPVYWFESIFHHRKDALTDAVLLSSDNGDAIVFIFPDEVFENIEGELLKFIKKAFWRDNDDIKNGKTTSS